MKAKELRAESPEKLKTTLTDLRRKQFKIRLVKSGGELSKTHDIKRTRRAIARIQTILGEKIKQQGEIS